MPKKKKWNKTFVILLVMFLQLFSFFSGYSQSTDELKQRIDSLKKLNDSMLPEMYMKVAERNMRYVDTCFKYAQLAEKSAMEFNNDFQLVRAKYALGFCYKAFSMYDSAIVKYSSAAKIAQDRLDDIEFYDRYNSILNGIGQSYTFQGNYDSALYYLIESYDRRQNTYRIFTDAEIDSTKYYYELAIVENNIGLVYLKIKDYDAAISYYQSAISNKNKSGDEVAKINLVNLALSYYGLSTKPGDENSLKAKRGFKEILDDCSSCTDNILFETYNGLGVLYLNEDSISKARDYLELALQYSENEGDLGKRLFALHNIASVYKESGNFADAIEILNRGQKWTDSLNLLPLQAENYKMLASVHRNAGNNSQAYDYMVKYDSLNSRIFNEELINGIKNVLVAQNQKTNDAELLKRDDRIKEIQQSRVYLTIIIILAFLILFIVVYNNRQRQKVNKKLSQANEIIEQKNTQLQNINYSLEEKVKDRTKELKFANEALKQSNIELDNFIYKTSHDIRGPLATLQGICNVALLDVKDEKAIDYLDKLNTTATKLNEILSKLLIINQINNSVISKMPILMNELIHQVVLDNNYSSGEKHIETRLSIEDNLKLRSDEDLLRIIISNLVNNAFKYYKKSYSINSFVEIRAFKNNLNIIIEVIDNGIGIDENAQSKIFEIFSKATEMSDSAGLGLYLVKLSVEKLNGSIVLERTIEGFTKFKVSLPINQSK